MAQGGCDNSALFLPSSACQVQRERGKNGWFYAFSPNLPGPSRSLGMTIDIFLEDFGQLGELFLFCLGFDDSVPESDSGVLKHLAVVFTSWSFEFPVSLLSAGEHFISLAKFHIPVHSPLSHCVYVGGKYRLSSIQDAAAWQLVHRMEFTLILSFHSACLWWGILKSDRSYSIWTRKWDIHIVRSMLTQLCAHATAGRRTLYRIAQILGK